MKGSVSLIKTTSASKQAHLRFHGEALLQTTESQGGGGAWEHRGSPQAAPT